MVHLFVIDMFSIRKWKLFRTSQNECTNAQIDITVLVLPRTAIIHKRTDSLFVGVAIGILCDGMGEVVT